MDEGQSTDQPPGFLSMARGEEEGLWTKADLLYGYWGWIARVGRVGGREGRGGGDIEAPTISQADVFSISGSGSLAERSGHTRLMHTYTEGVSEQS